MRWIIFKARGFSKRRPPYTEATIKSAAARWNRGSDWLLREPIIYLTKSELDHLPEYSCSNPTGTTIGKMWKRDLNAQAPGLLRPYLLPHKWMVHRYDKHENPELVKISSFQVRLKGKRIPALTDKQ